MRGTPLARAATQTPIRVKRAAEVGYRALDATAWRLDR
jgi:hypothetical protein